MKPEKVWDKKSTPTEETPRPPIHVPLEDEDDHDPNPRTTELVRLYAKRHGLTSSKGKP